MTSIQSIVNDAVEEATAWLDDNPSATESAREQALDEIITSNVPVMTTVLFQLVVDDNSLAFEDLERENDTPFTALQEAVERRIADAVITVRDERFEVSA